jgi:hypothetical protein
MQVLSFPPSYVNDKSKNDGSGEFRRCFRLDQGFLCVEELFFTHLRHILESGISLGARGCCLW